MNWESLYFPLGSHFLSANDVNDIEQQLKKFPLEEITIGDAGEINNCQVGRLMEDQPGEIPKILNQTLSKPILDFYTSPIGKQFFAQFLEQPYPQYVRRSQFNLLGKGSFVGRHLDVDSNPNYQIAAVLQLGSRFEGGDFLVYSSKDSNSDSAQRITPEFGSLTISFCRFEHEVMEVTSGTRTSFVCFITNDNLLNMRSIAV